MAVGVVVLGGFAAVWAIAGLALAYAPSWLFPMPVLVSAAITGMALRAVRSLPSRSEAEASRIGRLIGIWSAAEGVAMFVGSNACVQLNRADLVAATFSIIVGLHFLPLARGLPRPSYYPTGGALTLLGAAGLALPAIVTPPAVCLGAAAILWISILGVTRDVGQARSP